MVDDETLHSGMVERRRGRYVDGTTSPVGESSHSPGPHVRKEDLSLFVTLVVSEGEEESV